MSQAHQLAEHGRNEIGALRSHRLDRRIASHEYLISEIVAWERQRNASGARIKWMFTTAKAAPKCAALTPNPLHSASPNRELESLCSET